MGTIMASTIMPHASFGESDITAGFEEAFRRASPAQNSGLIIVFIIVLIIEA